MDIYNNNNNINININIIVVLKKYINVENWSKSFVINLTKF